MENWKVVDYIVFIDDGTIKQTDWTVYEQDGDKGIFHHWDYRDSNRYMYCTRIPKGEI